MANGGNEVRKTINIIFSTLLIVALMASCGSVSKMKKELNAIVVETAFTEPEIGFTTVDKIGEEVYKQQMILCEAYCETYDKTSYGLYENKFADIAKAKLMSELNNTRNRSEDHTSELQSLG